jgi:hypothetical protein
MQNGKRVMLLGEWQKNYKTRLKHLFSLIFKPLLEGNDLGF